MHPEQTERIILVAVRREGSKTEEGREGEEMGRPRRPLSRLSGPSRNGLIGPEESSEVRKTGGVEELEL